MDSCDYSLEEYTAVEDPIADPDFETFSLKRDQKYILPVLKEALAMSKEPISVLLEPLVSACLLEDSSGTPEERRFRLRRPSGPYEKGNRLRHAPPAATAAA